jgi:hypothetical protein
MRRLTAYLSLIDLPGMSPGGEPLTAAQWAHLVEGWYPQLTDTRLRQITWPEIDKHVEYVKAQLATGLTQT